MAVAAIEVLGRSECQQLLETQPVGRVGFVARGQPIILPVTYALHRGEVVFRTDEGSQLHASIRGARVAFQVDGLDARDQTGWSVLVKGPADAVPEGALLTELEELGLVPWAAGDKSQFMRIRTADITGRRLRATGELSDLWWG